jgi:hypothetical protein
VQRKLEAQLASHAGHVPRATKFRRRRGGEVVAPAPDAEAEPQAPRLRSTATPSARARSAMISSRLMPACSTCLHSGGGEGRGREALLLDSMAVRAPPSGGWHDPAHAPALAAYAAAVTFESSCAIARVQLVAWPCREYILDNDQFQTMISAHLGLLPADAPAAGRQAHPCPSCRWQWLAGAQSRRLQSY